MTLAQVLAETAAALAKAGFDEPRRQARRLLSAALDLPPVAVLAYPERPIDAEEAGHLHAMRSRLLAREPLSRILGRREFWSLEFLLSPETLDPRPESETLVEAVLARVPDREAPLRILDLGTGTGCLLLALLSELPSASGVGVDLSEGAAMTARKNACALGLAGRAHFVVGDWGAALDGGFDVIVANPPYIATRDFAALPVEVAHFDPVRALDGGPDGLAAYRALAGDVPRLLAPDGVCACEIGMSNAGAAPLFEAAGLILESCESDLAGFRRCLVLRAATKSQRLRPEGGKNRLEYAPVPSRLAFSRGDSASPEATQPRPAEAISGKTEPDPVPTVSTATR